MTDRQMRLSLILLVIIAGALLRLLPHPPNFAPIGAMALFSGAYLGRRPLALAAPVAALFASDLILGFYEGMIFQYAAVLFAVATGWLLLERHKGALRIGVAALASGILFFIVSNFGVWLGSGLYPRTLAGLVDCYVAAIPFFRNSLAGDLVYAAILFGGFALVQRAVPQVANPALPR